MTEHDDERAVSRRYRALPREEPPARLDDAILARAREAGRTVPAPLVPPTGRSRWYFPVAAAAILVLAVAVTWHVEREQPDAYVAAVPAPAAEQPKPAEPPREARDAVASVRKQRKESVEQETKKLEAPAPAAPAARGDILAAQRALVEAPEQVLERIARLRAEGRHEEADKALAEFRKRYPDFRISAEILEKVERK